MTGVRRAAKFRHMLDAWGRWGLYHATLVVTRDLSFSGLIRRTTPFSRLLQHTRGCGGSIFMRILTGSSLICKGGLLAWCVRKSI
jgi:hypothetical protein